MTCFWDALISGLGHTRLNKFCDNHPTQTEFINKLKANNMKTINIQWNGQLLRIKELFENFEHIKDFDVSKIRNGYDCSTADPFLFLVCQIFDVNIEHDYNGTKIKYTNVRTPTGVNIGPNGGIKNKVLRDVIKLRSNRGHIWHERR